MNQHKSKQIRKSVQKFSVEKWITHAKFGKVLNPEWKTQQKHLKRAYNLVPRNKRNGWIEENI